MCTRYFVCMLSAALTVFTLTAASARFTLTVLTIALYLLFFVSHD